MNFHTYHSTVEYVRKNQFDPKRVISFWLWPPEATIGTFDEIDRETKKVINFVLEQQTVVTNVVLGRAYQNGCLKDCVIFVMKALSLRRSAYAPWE